MNKNYNPTDLHQKEGQEQSKKLYRSISEHVRRLDDARSCARNVGDLFTPSLQILRSKFRDYCERLIFSDPMLYGRKGEELLWRKGFYEVVSTAKRLKKQEYTDGEKCNIQAHINSGIGFYHHFISRLQIDFEINLQGLIDFAILDVETNKIKKQNPEIQEWLTQSVHRTLIYLGDLCRYKLEIYPNWDTNLAVRYYSQAVYFKPDIGMPHNQMGTLASNFNLNHSLDAVYHYIRCMCSKVVFEGTENNLHRLFEKNSKYLEQLPVQNQESDPLVRPEPSEHIKRFISRFLLLTDIWFFSKKVPHIYNLCHQINVDLRECLSYMKPVSSEMGDGQCDTEGSETDSISTPSYINNEIIFKISVICLLCISKLQTSQSQQISNVVAFSLALYSQIIQHVVGHIHDGILNLPIPSEEVKSQLNGIKKKKKHTRRRRKLKSSSDESDLSDNEEENHVSSSDESITSDNELQSSSSEDEEDVQVKPDENVTLTENGTPEIGKIDSNTSPDGKSKGEIVELSKRLDVNDMLEIIAEEQLLQSIKVLSDWLSFDKEVLKSCGKATRPLFSQLIHLVNLINIKSHKHKFQGFENDINYLKENYKKIPLPEDLVLKGIDILAGAHTDVEWNLLTYRPGSSKEEAYIRILKLFSFAQYLTTIKETSVIYDSETQLFSLTAEENSSLSPQLIDELTTTDVDNGQQKKIEETKENEAKGQLMGKMWLAAEVRDLEDRVKGKTALSPYLVIDVDCLIKYTNMVRQLVYSRKFIVLVPTAALDELKREKLEARDAIRWLENQFKHGNRFFRAQRSHERLPLPFIKYPKKKDKEASIYIQIIECCHYLAEQQKGAPNLVTLLLGRPVSKNGQNKDISYVGLANSAGVNLEQITEFYSKWRKTSKGKR